MTFTVAERLLLLQILGRIEGNLVLVRQVRALQQAAGFSEQETAALEFHMEGSKYMWTEGAVAPIEVAIPPLVHAAIAKILDGESTAGRLTVQQLPLCDKFLPEVGADALRLQG